MFGRYRSGGETLPRVLHVTVARYDREPPKPEEPLEFLVSLHEEGTGITWQQNATVSVEAQRQLDEATVDLHLWSLSLGLTPKKARERIDSIGDCLYETFVGAEGKRFLETVTPTAVLLDVDETTLNWPWELIAWPTGILAQEVPLGRLVTTRYLPRPGRDPIAEDSVVKILAVANPGADLGSASLEIGALKELTGNRGDYTIEVDVLEGGKASRSGLVESISSDDYDILHFAGHASFDSTTPEASALQLADGTISAEDVLTLPWKKAPPYLVVNSACQSGRAAGGRRLISGARTASGLVAAFLASGVYGYGGYFWPVTDAGAGLFARAFYETLFLRENVGLAFLEARRYVTRELGDAGDLTGHSAILFGDAASKHRRDLATAV